VLRAVHADESLNIVVYGATGKVGSHVVQEALDRGHRVTAVSRNPQKVEIRHDNLSIVKGDLLDISSLTETVTGHDVVVLSVRGVIVLFRQEDRAPRLIHVGGAGTLEVEPGVLYAAKLPKVLIPKNLEIEILGQILALEFYHKVDDVRWTFITPPKNFTNGPRTGEFRIGGNRALEDDRGRTRVSRADFAVALIDEAEQAAHVRQQFSVAY
jgi:putative NADH-flavin reductase